MRSLFTVPRGSLLLHDLFLDLLERMYFIFTFDGGVFSYKTKGGGEASCEGLGAKVHPYSNVETFL